jgi:hypothetical protein
MSHDTKLDGRVRFGSSFAYVQNVITASGGSCSSPGAAEIEKKKKEDEKKRRRQL